MYRIRELERLTGVPRTTIHYYVREGILPRPDKSAPNAALYSEAHRSRLEAVRQLRGGPSPAPLSVVRRALELIDKGVPADVAVALQRSVVGDQPSADGAEYDSEGLAEASGLDRETIERLVLAGVLLPAPDATPPFDGLDLLVAQRIRALVEISDLDPLALAPFARGIRDVSRAEMQLRDRLVEGGDIELSARVSATGQALLNVWHNYLFARSRQHDAVEFGLGTADDGGSRRDPEPGT